MNPYKTLGIDETATKEQIKNAFRVLSKKYHPDNKESGDSKVFVEIKKAFEILSDKKQRDTYDLYGIASIDFDKEAKDLAFAIFYEVADKVPEGHPLDSELKRFVIEGLIPPYEKKMKELEELKTKLQRRLLRIIKKPEDDFITEASFNVLERYTKDYKVALLHRDLHKRALELLTEYTFDRIQLESSSRRPRSSLSSIALSNIFSEMNVKPDDIKSMWQGVKLNDN